MNRFGMVSLACVAMLAVSACSDLKRSLSRDKRAPDEFAVYQRAPLSVPPDFGLRPPTPGERRPQDNEPQNDARAALSRGSVPPSSPVPQGSPGVQALLHDTGADQAEPGIRAAVDRETTILAQESESVADSILFWREKVDMSNRVVNPEEESKRIRENQALGKPVNEGDVPVIEPRRKAILEGIFN
jgi:hypothetical protein